MPLNVLLLVCALCRPPSEEGDESEGKGGREVDSPPVEVRDEERREIFATRQKLSKYIAFSRLSREMIQHSRLPL